MLDYDGTLAPFQIDPDKAFPYPHVSELLNSLMQNSNNYIAIISGRWTKDLLTLLKLDSNPEIWGTHGLERLKPDGSYKIEPMDDHALKGLVEAEEWLTSDVTSHKVRYEQKPGSLAIHWRGLTEKEIETIKMEIRPQFQHFSDRYNLILKEFDGGLELRIPGKNKGDAVQALLSKMPKNSISAYLGDDLTDEDAFQAIKGKGLGILVRDSFRPTTADMWLKPPKEMLDFLSKWK
jgi:trehalose-phosphatase